MSQYIPVGTLLHSLCNFLCNFWVGGIRLFGVNEKLPAQHISGHVTKYKLL